MDTACARLSLGQNATPPMIEDAMRQVDDLEVQQRVLEREAAVGVDHSERLAAIAKQKTEVAARLKTLEERRDKELSLVSRIRDIRTQLEAAAVPAAATAPAAALLRPCPPLQERPPSLPRIQPRFAPNWKN